MNISNIAPVRIGSNYIARVNKFPINVYSIKCQYQ